MDEVWMIPAREDRTPSDQVGIALNAASDWFVQVSESTNEHPDPARYFAEVLFHGTARLTSVDGDKVLEEMLKQAYPGPDDESLMIALHRVLRIVVSYAIQAMRAERSGNMNLAWAFAGDASYWAGILVGADPKSSADFLRANARAGALARIANDPRQQEKEFVRECWQGWQQHPDRYRSKAEFARDMLAKCTHLVSTKKIEDWCRQWEANNGTQQAE